MGNSFKKGEEKSTTKKGISLKKRSEKSAKTMGNAMKKKRGEDSTIFVTGLYGTGKASIVRKLQEIVPKAEDGKKNHEGKNSLKLPGGFMTIVEFGGRMSFPHLPKAGQGLVVVVDSTADHEYMWSASGSRARMALAMNSAKRVGGKSDIPVLFLCNKQDLPGAMSPEEISEKVKISGFQGNPIKFVGCSAETADGLIEGLQWLNNAMSGSLELPQADGMAGKEEEATEATEESLDYDPEDETENPTLSNFAVIKKGTQCPFAKSARLWGGKPLSEGSTLEEQATANAPAINEFVRFLKNGKSLDGFCLDLDDESARTGGPEGLGECVRRVLTTLSDLDPASADSMKTPMVSSRGWKFQFAGCDFFVTTFAPFYPSTSSRYAFGSERAFLLLQPHSSFKRLPNDTPASATDYANPKDIRDKTRAAFREAGRSYHIPDTIEYAAAEHIVKPLKDDNTSVVRWWTPQQVSN